MAKSIGIDLGTTKCSAMVLAGDRPVAIKGAEGDRVMPSVVALRLDGRDLVGMAAQRRAITHPAETVTSIKRLLGRKYSEVAAEEQIASYRIVAGEDDAAVIDLNGHRYKPPEVAARMLGRLKADAEAFVGHAVDTAVMAAPASFTTNQRQATRDAARLAGLSLNRLMSEPTAAALAYSAERVEDQVILVVDAGGGMFDATVVDVSRKDRIIDVKATAGDGHLGGDDFNRTVVDWLATQARVEYGLDVTDDPVALWRLYEAAERSRIELSSLEQTQISVPYLATMDDGPKHLELRLTRDLVEELCAPLLDLFAAPVQRVLDDAARLDETQIDCVLLAGGLTRMPAVQARLRKLTGDVPYRALDPDEAVALGTAIETGIFERQQGWVVMEVTPSTIGVQVDGTFRPTILDRNTRIPVTRSATMSLPADEHGDVDVTLLQGEGDGPDDRHHLGSVRLMRKSEPSDQERPVRVDLSIDSDGIVTAVAEALDTGERKPISLGE